MGNGESASLCYFGTDVPEELREDHDSLQAVQDGFGSEKENAELAEFVAELDIPAEDWQENRRLCEDTALKCLRFRRFDRETAAVRFRKYIAWRRAQFGNLGPQNIDEHSPPEGESDSGDKLDTTRALLDLGVISILPHPSPQGHAVILLRLANTRPSEFVYHARQVCKAAHFMIMRALDMIPSAQAKGVVVVADLGHAGMSNIDRKVPPKMGKLLSGVLPVRLAGILICNPTLLVRVIVPLMKMFLSEKLAAYVRDY